MPERWELAWSNRMTSCWSGSKRFGTLVEPPSPSVRLPGVPPAPPAASVVSSASATSGTSGLTSRSMFPQAPPQQPGALSYVGVPGLQSAPPPHSVAQQQTSPSIQLQSSSLPIMSPLRQSHTQPPQAQPPQQQHKLQWTPPLPYMFLN